VDTQRVKCGKEQIPEKDLNEVEQLVDGKGQLTLGLKWRTRGHKE